MKQPTKCGKMYIMFDDKKNPEYGFIFSGNLLIKFIPLTDNPIRSIVLPKLVESKKCPDNINPNQNPSPMDYNKAKELKDYVSGSMKICTGCFEGVKEAEIVIPFDNSVCLEWGCFDSNSDIELFVRNTLDLKQIDRRCDNGCGYQYSSWTVIADKKLGGFCSVENLKDDYFISDYNENSPENKFANLTVKHDNQLTLSDLTHQQPSIY